MASLPGGPADKLGNEFERLWAVRHLIEVLSGKAISVTVESLGDDERGVEFWVARPDGTREAHQSKRENASKGHWTVADLAAKKILANAKFQLDRSPAHRFVFVSADKARSLSDLCERARRGDSADEFLAEAVTTSGGLKDEFNALSKHLALDPRTAPGARAIRDFLRRFTVHTADKLAIHDEVEDVAQRWISGDPGEAVRALKVFATRNAHMGGPLGAPDIAAALPRGCAPQDLAKHPSLERAVRDLVDRFDRSYGDLLIAGVTLGRREAAELEQRLTGESVPGLVLLHGKGGSGKSGVVFEFVQSLKARHIPYLALRADRDRPADSPHAYGEALGLPGAPSACLAALASGRTGVLILDQVDAIRWTAAHSAHAWDTCERVVAEALRSPNLMVVVVCRTFDVEDDVRINGWRAKSKAVELRVGELPDPVVDRIVGQRGVPPASLDPAQRRVLRSPQALFLWVKLFEADRSSPIFRTLTDLMRRFWELARRTLANLKPGWYDAAIGALVEYLDREGRLSAPRSVWGSWPEEVAGLVSMNVITREGDRLTFAHQSYLDYLTAERVLRGIHAGGLTIHAWLKQHDQSLFRRGQLRQLLALLRDENPVKYAEAVWDLLTAPDIRFHLQHLVLQMLGHADPPLSAEVDLVLGLLDDPSWCDHTFGQVLVGKPAWFDALFTAGLLAEWLRLPVEEARCRFAIGLLESVIASRPESADELLWGLRDHAARPKLLEAALWRADLANLPDRLFDIYVGVAEGRSSVTEYIDWKRLAQANPQRAMRLLATCVRVHMDDDPDGPSWAERNGVTGKEVLEALTTAAISIPAQAWDCMIAIVNAGANGRRQNGGGPPDGAGAAAALYRDLRHGRDYRVLVRRLLVAAGKALAREHPSEFWRRLVAVGPREPRALGRVLAISLAEGPDVWADRAIDWLLQSPRRLRCGTTRGANRHSAGRYRPARRLLRRFGRACSGERIRSLEAYLLRHRPSNEVEDFRSCHRLFMGTSFWGAESRGYIRQRSLFVGQYLLLSALPAKRLSPPTRDWIGVLRRKFGRVARLLDEPLRHVGGSVRSTIPGDRLHLVSDRQWLRIVKHDWSATAHRWKQMAPGLLGEVKAETFAGDLNAIARRQPHRFAALALRFPPDVDRVYPRAILRGLAEEKAPQGTPDSDGWTPASAAEIESVVDHFAAAMEDREFAIAFAWMIRQRASEPWSTDTLRRLAWVATEHPHPQAGEYTVSVGAGGRGSVVATSINCARGQAAEGIAAVLYDRPEHLAIFGPAIAALVRDPHPAVRVAAASIAIPLINVDKDRAVATFLNSCGHPEDEVLLGSEAERFLGYMLVGHLGALGPVVERMVASSVGEVGARGAAWATGVWLHTGSMREMVLACASRSADHRRGVADMLARELASGRGGHDAERLLVTLLNDPDEAVRKEAASVFIAGGGGVFSRVGAVGLCGAFVSSVAFGHESHTLLMGLARLSSPITAFATVVATIVDMFAARAAEGRDSRTRGPLNVSKLAEVLLKLYEQSENDRGVRVTCLDAWDRLLRERLGYDVLTRLDA